ncbi:MAG: ATPase domain-containing protein [Archaeoglobaceae archaeon]
MSQITENLEKLEGNFVVVVAPTEEHSDVRKEILEYWVKRKEFNGLYLSINKPVESLIKEFKNSGLDDKKILFIDGISKLVGVESDIDNSVALKHPSALTDLSIILTEEFKKKDKQFLFIDSISTMIVYNNEKTLAKFFHHLIANLKKHNLSCISLSLDERVEQIITQFSDSIIRYQ